MNNELKNELKIELTCSNCNFTKVITIGLDKDGVFTIPDKFCPNDLSELQRDVLRQFVSEPKPEQKPEQKPDAPTENKTKSANTVPKPARPVEVPKHRANNSKKS